MIKKQILQTKDEKDLFKKIKKELTKEAEYIGEDGDMCCIAKSPEAALRKFKKRWKDDVGPYDMPEFSLDDIGGGWLWLVDKTNNEEAERFEDSDWFIDYRNTSDCQVFVLNS